MNTITLSAYGTNHALDDVFFLERLKQVIAERNIQYVVETGLAGGYSTLKFCQLGLHVIGIDIDPAAIEATDKTLIDAGISTDYELHLGNSGEILTKLNLPPAEQTLFFLDAHNGGGGVGYWPLPDEINAVPRGQGILVFHDIKVPGKDFGYDLYFHEGKAQEFEYALVKDVLTAWSPNHRVEYMDKASGSYRGVAIVYPE